MFEVVLCSEKGALTGLYASTQIWNEQRRSYHARSCFPPESPPLVLGLQWVSFIEDTICGKYNQDARRPFRFSIREVHERDWKLQHKYTSTWRYEEDKFAILGLLAGVSRGFLDSKGLYSLRGVGPREMGRLISWVRAHTGLTQYERERLTDPGRKTQIPLGPFHDTDGESSEEGVPKGRGGGGTKRRTMDEGASGAAPVEEAVTEDTASAMPAPTASNKRAARGSGRSTSTRSKGKGR